ncbi:MAG TPA: hypothetical protein VF491_23255, partial [Vicinamibacterales bacterium]
QAVMEIQHASRRMQVTDPARPLRTLMLDGKAHAVPTDTGIQTANVVATMRGDTLIIETTQPFGGMPGNATLKITETWSLSADGKLLTIKTERELPAQKQSFSEVFNRR